MDSSVRLLDLLHLLFVGVDDVRSDLFVPRQFVMRLVPVFQQQVEGFLLSRQLFIFVLLQSLDLVLVVGDGVVLDLAGLRFLELHLDLVQLAILVPQLLLQLLILFLQLVDLAASHYQ